MPPNKNLKFINKENHPEISFKLWDVSKIKTKTISPIKSHNEKEETLTKS